MIFNIFYQAFKVRHIIAMSFLPENQQVKIKYKKKVFIIVSYEKMNPFKYIDPNNKHTYSLQFSLFGHFAKVFIIILFQIYLSRS